MKKIVFIVYQVGPYHHARFKNLAVHCTLCVIEIHPKSSEYDWNTEFGETLTYERIRINRSQVEGILESINPESVIITGWSDKVYLRALLWCKKQQVTAVGISDSNYDDQPRKWWIEWVKSHVVQSFNSFVVAGNRSRAYLTRLGFETEKIFDPWDVVDNEYFARWPLGKDLNEFQRKNHLPNRYWVCVARLIPKKNHLRLLNAYAKFVNMSDDCPALVLLGSGEMEEQIKSTIDRLELQQTVSMYGFVQNDELPGFYHLSEGLILASEVDQWGLVVNEAMACGIPVAVSKYCGCSDDLIEHEKNGLVFDSLNESEITSTLLRFDRLKMDSYRSNKLFTKFSLRSFTNAIFNASQVKEYNKLGIVANSLLMVLSR